MSLGGFGGNILMADLAGKLDRRPLPQDLARQYIGGLGLSIKLAHTAIKPGTPALAPEAAVVLGVGPLVGTSLPAASRVYAVAKLPAGGAIGWCGGGGVSFGSHFKNCGLDHIVLTGRADRPSILRLEDDQARLDDAAEFSGLGIEQTIELARKKYGPCGVLCIGPSGKNLVAMAMASIDGMATIGRGGLGAVLGSKNLKAVVATGSLGVSVADRKAFGKVSRGVFKQMRDYAYLKQWQELGLLKSLPVVPPEYYLSIKKRRVACVSCPIGDKDIIEIPDGPYAGLRVCTSSAVNLFTPTIFGLKDKEQAIKLTSMLDDLGLDLFEFFAAVGLAARLAAQGAIPQDMLPMAIDNTALESLEYWAGAIAFKQGLGTVMAGGIGGLLEKYGPPADGQAPPMIKGLSPYVGPGAALPWDLFGTQELGQALDPRGPHVGASGSPTYFARRPLEVFPKHLKRMGVPDEALERILPGLGTENAGLKVGALLKYSHRWFTVLGSLGVCARAQINRFYNAEILAQAYSAATGIESSFAELGRRADRAWTVLRLMNLAEGQGRQADILPGQWFGKGGFRDYVTEKPAPQDHFETMVDDYYQEQGWAPDSGAPLPETLASLGLDKL